MSTQASSTTQGVAFSTMLGLLFLTLKLCGQIHWPWLWVLSPFWIPWALLLIVLALIGLLAAGSWLVVAWLERKR